MTKNGSLIIYEAQRSDGNNYSCNIENNHGKDEIIYNLYVRGELFKNCLLQHHQVTLLVVDFFIIRILNKNLRLFYFMFFYLIIC